VAGALDVGQADRASRGHALGDPELALEHGVRVGPGVQVLRQGARGVLGGLDQAAALPRVGGDVEDLVHQGAGGVTYARRHRGDRSRDRVHRSRAMPVAVAVRERRGRDRAVRRVVGERHHHARERDPVRDAVVHPGDDRAARTVALDEVHVPQRFVVVERRGHQVGHQLQQSRLVARCRKGETVKVVLEIEARIVLPGDRAPRDARLGDALAEAGEALDQAFPADLLDVRPVDRRVKPQDQVDDRQVRRPIHVQPRHVGGGHRVVLAHV
jgi:hypothetical protein